MRVAAVAAVLALLLAACAGTTPGNPPTSTAPPATPIHFIALGDAGTGEADQYRVAAAIAAVCEHQGCDFAVDLGDNIYDSGASSATDPQFEAKFEKPYANLTMPFYMVLGNHDNGGPDPVGVTGGFGAWYQAGNHEVDYAKRTDRASDKWTMPARYYMFQHGPVAFVVVDTNTLTYEDAAIPPDQVTAIQAQTSWIDGAVTAAAANASWVLAMGHHPYLSNGPHGNAGAYDGHAGVPGQSGDYLKQFFEAHVCGKVDAYLSGHDHDLEWLDPVAACGKTQFIVSGGGGAATYELTGKDSARFQDKTLGFWWVEATSSKLRAVAYDANATLLVEVTMERS